MVTLQPCPLLLPGDKEKWMAWLPAFAVIFFLEAVSEGIRPHLCGLERKDPGAEGNPGCVCLLGVGEE